MVPALFLLGLKISQLKQAIQNEPEYYLFIDQTMASWISSLLGYGTIEETGPQTGPQTDSPKLEGPESYEIHVKSLKDLEIAMNQ